MHSVRVSLLRSLAALAVLFAACAGPAGASGEGASLDDPLLDQAAPGFLLPTVAGAIEVASDTLFEAYGATLVAFWTTHCAECTKRMETCQELYEWGEPQGINIVGINFDDHRTAKMRGIVERAAPDIVNLYDPGGRVSAIYGAGAHSFGAYIVDTWGTVRAVYYEIMPDGLAALRPDLLTILNEAFADDGYDEPQASDPTPIATKLLADHKPSKITLAGRGRTRWMSIGTTGEGAKGSDGKALQPGTFLHHRIELELGYDITTNLMAGGLLRISNEGPMVLRTGPDYLSSETGAFFVRHDAEGSLPLLGRVSSRLIGGYYRVELTPFTLMRWDLEDTPISGGQRSQGCGVCGGDAGMAGFMRPESLEKLGPELAFEGARWDLTLFDRFDLLALYARPQRPNPTTSSDCGVVPHEDTHYHQDLYAVRLGSHFPLAWTPDLFEVGATGLIVDEDAENAPCATMDMWAPPFQNMLLSGDAVLPLPNRMEIKGEVTASHSASDKNDARCAGEACYLDGMAYKLAGSQEIRITSGALTGFMAKVQAAYLHIDADFLSPYGSLSAEPNRQGFRVGCRADWRRVGLGGFYKRQAPLEENPGPSYVESDQEVITASIWMDATVWKGAVLMVGGVFEDRDIFESDAAINPTEDEIRMLGPHQYDTLILSLTQEIGPKCTLMVEAEWKDGIWKIGELNTRGNCTWAELGSEEYNSTVIRLLMDVEF